MQWTSEAIILKQEPFSDDKLLCHMFSSTHGLYKGLLTLGKKTRNQIQVGNIVEATWRARLEEHLGSYYCELLKPLSMNILNDKLKLTSVLSLCSILSTCLPTRTIEPRIYDETLSYLLTLKDHHSWLIDYIKLELLILQELGYGLNLDSCSVTGSKKDLYYVSPKTGNVVSKEVGKDYHDKLFILPQFLIQDYNQSDITKDGIINGLKLIEYFIDQRIYKENSKAIPEIRVRFTKLIKENLFN